MLPCVTLIGSTHTFWGNAMSYEKPVLTVEGSLVELTLSAFANAGTDNTMPAGFFGASGAGPKDVPTQ